MPRRAGSRSPAHFVVVLVVVAAIGAFAAATGGFSDEAVRRVPPGSDSVVGTISEGEAVDLDAFAARSGRTVFFFTKPWCGACWRLAPQVEEAVRAAGDATLRIVDIRSWESEAARHHAVVATPHLVLYVDGEPAVRGVAEVLAHIAR